LGDYRHGNITHVEENEKLGSVNHLFTSIIGNPPNIIDVPLE
jgi:hypothetical protein